MNPSAKSLTSPRSNAGRPPTLAVTRDGGRPAAGRRRSARRIRRSVEELNRLIDQEEGFASTAD